MRTLLAVLLAILAISVPAYAGAATTFDWSYAASSGSPSSAKGTFVGDQIGPAEYVITAITGMVGTDSITGIIPNLVSPSPYFDGQLNYTNLLSFTLAGPVDPPQTLGIKFAGASGNDYVLQDEIAPILFVESGNGVSHTIGTFTVSSAPEPAIWIMMFLGLAILGGALRFKRHQRFAALCST